MNNNTCSHYEDDVKIRIWKILHHEWNEFSNFGFIEVGLFSILFGYYLQTQLVFVNNIIYEKILSIVDL